MSKLTLLKIFNPSYWKRRRLTLAKWKSRKTSIKYIFKNKLAIKDTIIAIEKPASFNELMKSLYEKSNDTSNNVSQPVNNIMSERISDSYEHLH